MTLSDNIWSPKQYPDRTVVHTEHIKEFIRKLKEEMPDVLTTTRGELITLHEIIDKRAGSELAK